MLLEVSLGGRPVAKAEFPNQDEKLFPNQFVNIRLRVQTLKDAVVIPTAAVQFGSRGPYVFIVNEQNLAMVRDLQLGPADGEFQSILKGLKPGEKVITEGVDRLREGRAVTMVIDEPVAAKKATEAAPIKSGGDPTKKRKKQGT